MSNGVIFNVTTNFPRVMAELESLSPEMGGKVMARAFNATMPQGRTAMARGISKEFMISAKDAKERLSVKKASASGGSYSVEASLEATKKAKGRSMNLIAFAEKLVTLTQARKRVKDSKSADKDKASKALQIRFQVRRTGGKKVITGAFIGNKGRTMFIRSGKDRLPITALNTIDVTQMFNTKRINTIVVDTMLKNFQKNFDRELRAVLKGFIK